MKRFCLIFSLVLIFTLLAVISALAAPPPAAPQQKPDEIQIGLKAGYNYADMVVNAIYEEHPSLTVWHEAVYCQYDFGMVRVGGTLWNYSLNAGDGMWRMQGDPPIDQTYIEMGSGGVFGPSVDVTFDIPVSRRVVFNPGIGLGIGFRYGKITQYDYESRPGAVAASEEDLTEEQVRPQVEDNGKSFTSTFPLLHLDLDWMFLIDRNWYATANIGFQTFGPNFGLGVGYQF